MNMGDSPGHMMRRMAGKKLFGIEALPSDFINLADEKDPGLIQNAPELVGLGDSE